LKDGLGFIPASKKPLAGTKPSGEDFIHIVPPVMIIKTLDSGNWTAMVKPGVLKPWEGLHDRDSSG
jgi:hypothetical protein